MKHASRIAAALLLVIAAAPLFCRVDAAMAPEPSHARWQKFLSRYLDTSAADGVNRLRYSAVTQEDKALLDGYLRDMQRVNPNTQVDPAKRAFWINLYNAQTAASVIKALPLKSIRDIRIPGSASQGPWDAKLLKVDGAALSLNDIENKILRVKWKDNRIHFALNCASIGCPNLTPLAFTRGNLEAQLEKGAKDFMKSPRGIAFDGTVLKLSSLFDWYKADFGKTDREVLESLARYAPPETAARLKSHSGKVKYQYDWNLNGI
ncbi:MAG: DUF547 domain-containing protein [Fibrobacterota bacterium]|nr:DUF547 domain-containing protein [Fibrobacterota bacterium]